MREHNRSDDPEVIERELEETRARVDRTIDQIQDRLSPGQLLDEGLRYFRDGQSDYLTTFGTNLSHSVRDNPLPVTMIGLGMAWLAFGQRHDTYSSNDGSHARSWRGEGGTTESSAERARAAAARLQRSADESEEAFERRRQQAMAKVLDVKEQAGETTAALKARVAGALNDASARWEEMKESGRRRSHDVRDSTSQGMARARNAMSGSWASAGRTSDKAMEIFEQQPLLAAAAGVTVGALLGSLFPTTERENEALGAHRENLRRQTEAFGREAAHSAKEAGSAAAEAALHEVDRSMDDRTSGESRSSSDSDDRPAPDASVASGPAASGQRSV